MKKGPDNKPIRKKRSLRPALDYTVSVKKPRTIMNFLVENPNDDICNSPTYAHAKYGHGKYKQTQECDSSRMISAITHANRLVQQTLDVNICNHVFARCRELTSHFKEKIADRLYCYVDQLSGTYRFRVEIYSLLMVMYSKNKVMSESLAALWEESCIGDDRYEAMAAYLQTKQCPRQKQIAKDHKQIDQILRLLILYRLIEYCTSTCHTDLEFPERVSTFMHYLEDKARHKMSCMIVTHKLLGLLANTDESAEVIYFMPFEYYAQRAKIPSHLLDRFANLKVLSLHGVDMSRGGFDIVDVYTTLSSPLQSIVKLTKLEKLTLVNCNITMIPAEFVALVCLKELRLDFNVLQKFPTTILHLTKLVALDLSYNKIDSVPSRKKIKKMLPGCRIIFKGNPAVASICHVKDRSSAQTYGDPDPEDNAVICLR